MVIPPEKEKRTSRMMKAVASKKAMPSKPWFSSTLRRLPAGTAVTAVSCSRFTWCGRRECLE